MKLKGIVTKGQGSSKLVREHQPDIKGIVIKGDNKTYTKEIKTANIECVFKKGLYTGMTEYGACLVISLQDTYVANNNLYNQAYQNEIVEVYIIGWEGDLYGKELEVWDIIDIPWWRMCDDFNYNKNVDINS